MSDHSYRCGVKEPEIMPDLRTGIDVHVAIKPRPERRLRCPLCGVVIVEAVESLPGSGVVAHMRSDCGAVDPGDGSDFYGRALDKERFRLRRRYGHGWPSKCTVAERIEAGRLLALSERS